MGFPARLEIKLLDGRVVIPADIGIDLIDELRRGEGPPITRREQRNLQAPEEALTCGIVLRTCLS